MLGRKRKKSPVAGASYFESAFSSIQSVLSTEHPWTLLAIFWRVYRTAAAARLPELSRVLLDYVANVSARCLGEQHPYSVVFRGLARYMDDVEKRNNRLAFEAFSRLIRDRFEWHSGLSNDTVGAYRFHAQFESMLVEGIHRHQITEASSRLLITRLSAIGAEARCNIMRLELTHSLEFQGRSQEAIPILERLVAAPVPQIDIPTKLDSFQRLARF